MPIMFVRNYLVLSHKESDVVADVNQQEYQTLDAVELALSEGENHYVAEQC